MIYYSVRHGVLVVSHEHVLRMSHEPPPGGTEHALVWLKSDEQATQFKLPGPQGPHLHRVCRRITKDFHGQVIDAGQQ